MARRGDGIYLRGRTWMLHFTYQRGAIVKGEAGIGSPKRVI
jgi:hypothetical protein